jgi:putative endonuclease
LERNYWQPWGEIDIIARAPDGTLVFAEVKAFSAEPASGIQPEDNLTPAKLKKMRRAAASFAAGQPRLMREGAGWRIDALAVVLADPPVIRHYENV